MIKSAVLLSCYLLASVVMGAQDHWVYFGTYTSGKSESKGIYRARLDPGTGKISEAELAAEINSPSFLQPNATGTALYAVVEGGGNPDMSVQSFALHPQSGDLTMINHVESGGKGPCHITLHPQQGLAAVANYNSGSTAIYQVREDGGLLGPTDRFQHEGSSVNEKRQAGPHAHSVNFSRDGRQLYVCDLGTDEVWIYSVDETHGKLQPPQKQPMPAGSGPRHLAVHPSDEWVFVNLEMTMQLCSLRRDPENGSLELVETLSTLPNGESAGSGQSTAEVLVHPNGRWVMVSNRGHNTLAIFAFDAQEGRLTQTAVVPCGGAVPRNFALDPSGRWLVVAHQGSSSVAVFDFDAETGELKDTDQRIQVPTPVCVRFSPVAN